MAEKTIFKTDEQVEEIVAEPGYYTIILHNDDYTSMDFVVSVLRKIFHKPFVEADKLMLEVHKKGKSKVASYPYDIAATKVVQVHNYAEKEGFPLKCTMEKEE
jgi:ATP-dependent Clp protease adaptor protein ClpS